MMEKQYESKEGLPGYFFSFYTHPLPLLLRCKGGHDSCGFIACVEGGVWANRFLPTSQYASQSPRSPGLSAKGSYIVD